MVPPLNYRAVMKYGFWLRLYNTYKGGGGGGGAELVRVMYIKYIEVYSGLLDLLPYQRQSLLTLCLCNVEVKASLLR